MFVLLGRRLFPRLLFSSQHRKKVAMRNLFALKIGQETVAVGTLEDVQAAQTAIAKLSGAKDKYHPSGSYERLVVETGKCAKVGVDAVDSFSPEEFLDLQAEAAATPVSEPVEALEIADF